MSIFGIFNCSASFPLKPLIFCQTRWGGTDSTTPGCLKWDGRGATKRIMMVDVIMMLAEVIMVMIMMVEVKMIMIMMVEVIY